MEVDVEEECLKIIALHQPVATDLRFLIAVIKINNDLERIGDQVVNIAQRVVSISKHPVVPLSFRLFRDGRQGGGHAAHEPGQPGQPGTWMTPSGCSTWTTRWTRSRTRPMTGSRQAIADGVTEDIGYMINLLLISQSHRTAGRSCYQYCRRGGLHDRRAKSSGTANWTDRPDDDIKKVLKTVMRSNSEYQTPC
jgi:phosphate transport system protein